VSALATHAALFVAHRRALPGQLPPQALAAAAAVWVPGLETWYALARRGLWVQGCAEGLGFDSVRASLREPVLQLPPLRDWLVLTHAAAVDGWQMPEGPRVLATYAHAVAATAASGAGPLGASHVYWHSAAQYLQWNDGGRARFSAVSHHACAFGKTAARLRAAGLAAVTEFPSVQQWREWLRDSR
jgi:hypothetical protein